MNKSHSSTGGLRVSKKARRSDTRSTNLRLVLQYLFSGATMSRADLARSTGLTPATVSTLVNELRKSGLVTEGVPSLTGPKIGKPPTLLRIKADALNAVSVDLSDPLVRRAALIDLAGTVLARYEDAANGEVGDEAEKAVVSLAERACAVSDSPIVGVGIASPGIVSSDGTVVLATEFEWQDLDLQTHVSSAVNLPTYVINDSNAAAIAEFSRGGHESMNIGVITIGSGVGAGFILNGQPFLGASFGAGEIGHMVVDPDGPLCRCGNTGCLETFVSLPILKEALAKDGVDGERARKFAASRLGVAMASIVSILNVEHIIISGQTTDLGESFCLYAKESLRTRCLSRAADSTKISLTSLGEDSMLLGAAATVLSQELGVA